MHARSSCTFFAIFHPLAEINPRLKRLIESFVKSRRILFRIISFWKRFELFSARYLSLSLFLSNFRIVQISQSVLQACENESIKRIDSYVEFAQREIFSWRIPKGRGGKKVALEEGNRVSSTNGQQQLTQKFPRTRLRSYGLINFETVWDGRPLFDGAANGRNSSSGSRMLRILGERVRDKSRSNLQ